MIIFTTIHRISHATLFLIKMKVYNSTYKFSITSIHITSQAFKRLGSLELLWTRTRGSHRLIYVWRYHFYSPGIRAIMKDGTSRIAGGYNNIILVSGGSLSNDALLMTFKIDISSWRFVVWHGLTHSLRTSRTYYCSHKLLSALTH